MSLSHATWVFIALVVFGAGWVAAVWNEDGDPARTSFASEDLAQAGMSAQVSGQRLRALEEELAEQKQAIAALREEIGLLSSAALPGSSDSEPGSVGLESDSPADETEGDERMLERLTAANMDVFLAEELLDAVDALALERLRRRYASARGEGDNEMPLPTTRALVEDQFGEDAYDKYLYASGRGNRLVVRSVMANSAAEDIGMRAGDRLISVAGRRIYSTRDLMRAIGDAPGSQVALTFERGSNVLNRLIPAGPLGISAGRESVNPGLAAADS